MESNMDSFFDTSVVMHYATYSKLVKNRLLKKCYEHVTNKKGEFLLGYYVEEEIKNRIKKRRIIFQEALNKIINPLYEFTSSKCFSDLSKRDKDTVKKLYIAYKKKQHKKVKEIFSEDQQAFEMKINRFLKYLVDKRIIRINEIKKELLDIIKEHMFPHADSLVLTSALQAQENRKIFYFVAADKHFSQNDYDFLKKDPRLKNIKFPELKNFLFQN